MYTTDYSGAPIMVHQERMEGLPRLIHDRVRSRAYKEVLSSKDLKRKEIEELRRAKTEMGHKDENTKLGK